MMVEWTTTGTISIDGKGQVQRNSFISGEFCDVFVSVDLMSAFCYVLFPDFLKKLIADRKLCVFGGIRWISKDGESRRVKESID